MSYPVLTTERAQELAELLKIEIAQAGDPLQIYLEEGEWCGTRSGDDYEPLLIEKAADSLRKLTVQKINLGKKLAPDEQYHLEAEMAGLVHSAISQLSLDLLEDEDFWRYLALFPFRWYLIAREPELQPQDFGGYSEVDDGSGQKKKQRKSLITQLLYRTFLWGKIAFDEDQKDRYRRAVAVSEVGGPSIDVWHSHMIRTQLGQLGKLPHAFLDTVVEIKPVSMMKNGARETEKRLARMKHNVLFDVYDKVSADAIVAEQLSKIA